MLKRLESYYWEFRYRLRCIIWNIASRHSRLNGIILMYHNVTDQPVDTLKSCKCTVKEFEATLAAHQNDNRVFVSVDEMMELIKNKVKTPFSVVTFDDVPQNFYKEAYPILKRMQIPFVLFICIDFINKEGFLSKEQLLKLDKDPLCTIGAHTVTHPMLRKVKNSTFELEESKKCLENMLGHSIYYMAYPYGRQSSVSHRIMKKANRAGYKCAFGTIQTPISDLSSKSVYYLPRIVG